MNNIITIDIFKLINHKYAFTAKDGELLYKKIIKELKNKEVKIILDFIGIEGIAPTFLNHAIGQLYGKYNSSFLNKHLKLENLDNYDLDLFKIVINNAKKFYKQRLNNA